MFGVGMTIWAFRFAFQFGCNMAFSSLFDSLGNVINEACMTLAFFGYPDIIFCDASLVQASLRPQYVSYVTCMSALPQSYECMTTIVRFINCIDDTGIVPSCHCDGSAMVIQ